MCASTEVYCISVLEDRTIIVHGTVKHRTCKAEHCSYYRLTSIIKLENKHSESDS